MTGPGSDLYDDPNEISTLDGDLRIGEFLVRPLLKQIVRLDEDGAPMEEHSLPDKAMGVLVYLAGNARQVCERDDILDAVWGENRDAYDRVLDNAVAEIRRVFGDDARKPSYVQTVPRVGYRLIRTKTVTPNSGFAQSKLIIPFSDAEEEAVSERHSSAALGGAAGIGMRQLLSSLLLIGGASVLALGLVQLLPGTTSSSASIHIALPKTVADNTLVSRQEIERALFEEHPCQETLELHPFHWFLSTDIEISCVCRAIMSA